MAGCALIITLLMGGAAYVPANDCSLEIVIYNLDNRRLWTYAIGMTSLSVTWHSPSGEPDRLMYRRGLTAGETKKLDRFLARYPFGRLEKYYVNERINGNTGTVYRIRINKNIKDVFVFYARPEQVLELNRFINRLLPRQFHLWDEPSS